MSYKGTKKGVINVSQKEADRRYYLKNKEKILKRVKEYTEKNKEKIAKRKKLWYINKKITF